MKNHRINKAGKDLRDFFQPSTYHRLTDPLQNMKIKLDMVYNMLLKRTIEKKLFHAPSNLKYIL